MVLILSQTRRATATSEVKTRLLIACPAARFNPEIMVAEAEADEANMERHTHGRGDMHGWVEPMVTGEGQHWVHHV
jgi:hypothetical protein